MGRYITARCPNCGKLAHRCACGTMQEYNQLPPRLNPNNQAQPRDFIQQQPQAQMQMQVAPHDVDQMLQIPMLAQRIDQIVNEACASSVAQYQAANPPTVVQEGVHDRDLMMLSNVDMDTIPGDMPEKNTGGRKNTYVQGRKEVHTFFVKQLRDLLIGDPDGEDKLSDGGTPPVEAQNNDDGAGKIQGGVPTNYTVDA